MYASNLRSVIAVTTILIAAPAAAHDVEGLGGPLFGLTSTPNGDLLVADAGVGVLSIRRGELGPTIPLPGVTDVDAIGRGAMWAVTGGAPDPTADSGQGLHWITRHGTSLVANLYEFEAAFNPDAPRPVDSNPFDVQALGAYGALVADAGGNDLLRVDRQGNVHVLAIFPDELVSTENIKSLAGCPSPAPFCGLPDFMPAQPVPTSIAIGRDGYIYVGELKGFPAPTGESNIWRISPQANWAQCGASPDCVKVFDGGFTSIIDLAFGPNGKLYVAEFDAASWAAVEIFGTPVGGTVQACNLELATCHEVASSIPEMTAIAFGKDGSLWATQNALVAGEGEVVKLRRGTYGHFRGRWFHRPDFSLLKKH